MVMKNKPCHCCAGSGEETDDVKTGRALSGIRLRAGITLREHARRMGISHTYLWQLENGKRSWTTELKKNYSDNINK